MGRNLGIFLLLLLACYSVAPLHARFTKTTCWTGQNTACIQQNAQGAWCYIPDIGAVATACTGTRSPNDADFATVLEVHLAQGLSVAYYNGIDNSVLGGADYPIPSNPGVIRLCVSGQSGDGNFQTLCVNALADNTLGGDPYCQVVRGQNNVTDGCYSPTMVVHNPSPIISSPRPLSTSPSGFPNSTPTYSSSAQSLKPIFHGVMRLWVTVVAVTLSPPRAMVFDLLLLLVAASPWVPAAHALSDNATSWGFDNMQQKTGTMCYLPNSGCAGYPIALLDAVQVFGRALGDWVVSGHQGGTGEYNMEIVGLDDRPSMMLSFSSGPIPSNVPMPNDTRHRLSWLKSMLQEASWLWVPVILVFLSSTRWRLFALRFLPVMASSWFPSTHARFTQTTCAGDQCIEQNSVGTWCFAPDSSPLQTTSCTGGNPANANMASVMEVHLSQGLSIAFYNGIDNGFLGGANFSVPANPGIMRMCVSGQAGNGQLKTVCENVSLDNSFDYTDIRNIARSLEGSKMSPMGAIV